MCGCKETPCDPCKKCNSSICKCTYSGPDYTSPEIFNGQDINEAISNIAEYIQDIDFEDGVGISDVLNNNDGTFTITLTNGSSYTVGNFTGPQGPQGPPGPLTLPINNTLIVAKNGNDSTAARNDWEKPFLTITAASTAAQSGDVVIIFPGTYNEASDWVKSDVFYYFNTGAVVTRSTHCINDGGAAKNIFIYGNGKFRSSAGSCVLTTNSLTNLNFEFEEAFGFNDCLTLVNGSNVYIKGKKASQTTQYVLTLRGNYTGIIDIENWESINTSGAAAIFIVSHAMDSGVSKKVTLRGNSLISNSRSGFGAIAHSACGRGSIIIDEIKRVENTDSACDSIYFADSGYLKAVNKTIISQGVAAISNNSVLELKDVNISAYQKVLATEDGTTVFKNVDIVSNISSPSFIVTGISRVFLLGCTASSFDVGSVMLNITSDTAELSIGNSIFTIVNATGTEKLISSGGTGNKNIKLLTNNSSNVPLDSSITNIITGTSLIVDSDILLLGSLIEI